MNRVEFLEKFENILQYEGNEKLTFSSNLLDIDEWDSLSIISVVALMDSEFGKKVTVADLQNADTIEDLAKMAGI